MLLTNFGPQDILPEPAAVVIRPDNISKSET